MIERAASVHDLTEREAAILLLAAERRATREICERLHIGQATLISHVRSIKKKLGVATLKDAVILVLCSEIDGGATSRTSRPPSFAPPSRVRARPR